VRGRAESSPTASRREYGSGEGPAGAVDTGPDQVAEVDAGALGKLRPGKRSVAAVEVAGLVFEVGIAHGMGNRSRREALPVAHVSTDTGLRRVIRRTAACAGRSPGGGRLACAATASAQPIAVSTSRPASRPATWPSS
jgi:hypothetical protein